MITNILLHNWKTKTNHSIHVKRKVFGMITMATYFEGIEIGEEATIPLLCQFSKRIFDSLLLAMKIIPLTYGTSGYPGYSWAGYLHTATGIAHSDVILFVYVTFRTIHELIFMNNRKGIESDSRSRSSLFLLKNPVILLVRYPRRQELPRYPDISRHTRADWQPRCESQIR